ncbi:MAG: class I SAM-dependent methyltransferase [Solirubrobacterales bacterium]|nr:class I SAM-dependent methyltransferase [Solirubrobacterales bacterium]
MNQIHPANPAASRIDQARRTSFGAVAEQYHASRPSYPPEMVDDVIIYAGAKPGTRAVEVGAGTGIATKLFADRGLEIDAIEPSAEMANVAAKQATTNKVHFRSESFEDADLKPDAYKLVYSAQAWHWVEPLTAEKQAARALRSGGALACFWNRVDWDRCALRDELDAAYEESGWRPEGPMGPRSKLQDFSGPWTERIAATAGLSSPESREYRWSQTYSTAQYIALLGTHSDHILLDEALRIRLFGAIAGVIDDAGGKLDLTYSTRLCLARAS